jgi:hypothetical protein
VTSFLLNQTKKVVERSKFSQLSTFGRSNITFQNIKWCKNKVKKNEEEREKEGLKVHEENDDEAQPIAGFFQQREELEEEKEDEEEKQR